MITGLVSERDKSNQHLPVLIFWSYAISSGVSPEAWDWLRRTEKGSLLCGSSIFGRYFYLLFYDKTDKIWCVKVVYK